MCQERLPGPVLAAVGDRSLLCVLPLIFLGPFEGLNCYESKIGHSG